VTDKEHIRQQRKQRHSLPSGNACGTIARQGSADHHLHCAGCNQRATCHRHTIGAGQIMRQNDRAGVARRDGPAGIADVSGSAEPIAFGHVTRN
jgi:hypothetical protein